MAKLLIFIGAGASAPFGIPTMTELAQRFEEWLEHEARLADCWVLFRSIKSKLQSYRKFDIEALISVLQDIIDFERVPDRVFNQPSIHYFSAWGVSFEKMVEYSRNDAERDLEKAKRLLAEVKRFTGNACVAQQYPFEIYDEFLGHVSAEYKRYHALQGLQLDDELRAPKAKSSTQFLVFTTNYDQVLEAYCRQRDLAYNCGQDSLEMLSIDDSESELYNPDMAVETFQIFKLHGSINWYRDQKGRMRWLTEAALPGKRTSLGDRIDRELLIYPAVDKYTFREPFYTMFHHLKECLTTSEIQMCYIVGYSFRDEDILGLFHDAIGLNPHLRLCLIDPNAEDIVLQKFGSFTDRVEIIPRKFTVEAADTLASPLGPRPAGVKWLVSLTATKGTASVKVTVGVANGASNQHNSFNAAEPPPPPPPFVRVYVPHNAESAEPWPAPYDTTYSQDIRPPSDSLAWVFDVQSSSSGTVTLTWEVSAVPAMYSVVRLKDKATQEVLVPDMRLGGKYSYSTAAYVPKAFSFEIVK